MNLLLAPFKLISKIINLLVLVLVFALIFHNFTAKWLLIFGLSSSLGAPVKIGKVKIGWKATEARFGDIEISNAPGFGSGALAKIPELYMDFEISSLWEGRLHLEDLAVDIAQLHVMRLPDGRVNLFGLKPMRREEKSQEGSAGREPVLRGQEQGETSIIKYQIDRLELTLGRATYSDLTIQPPAVRAYNINVRQAVYENINGVDDAVKIILWESLKRMGLKGFSGILDGLGRELGFPAGVSASAKSILDKALEALNR